MASCLDPSEIPSFIEKIPCLLECHQRQYPGAKELERIAKKLINNKFQPTESVEFVKKVCKWSKGYGFVLQKTIPDNNKPEEIASALCEAYVIAQKDAARGVERIKKLQEVGQSFASKMLRFLLPDHAVILDRIIRDKCDYKETVHGYTKFLKFCQDLRKQARRSQKLPANLRGRLRICDIEAALFVYIQKPVP